jgi:aldehyde:ferredoxin oxidoreductase
VRRGLRRADEEAPDDHWKYRDAKLENDLKDAYYKHRGWNNEGIPTRETLQEMDLDYIAEDLVQREILTG